MGRFDDPQDPLFQALNSSIRFDYRLAPYDLEQSRAHARMLARSAIISDEDLEALERGLDAVRAEIEGDTFVVAEDDEDIHMAIERRLTEIAGPVGGKLHTARSRNDQVATDVAMLVRAHSLEAKELLQRLMATLVSVAERHLDWRLPGYTHLQRAQPVYLSHHLLAYFWKFRRDLQRFNFCMTATDDLPLGAGALAGVNFDTSRMFVAQELGFGGIAENSLDAVSNRDFVLDYLAAAATCATHLSQLGGEIVLWSTQEFGFCEVADAFSSGSSLMPQKKNPDAAELLRAKAPRVAGHLMTLHGVLHGLPLTYNKDLQEDKEPLFDAVDTLELCLRVAARCSRGSSSTASGWRRPPRTSSSRPPTWPTCWCAAACRSARPTASSAGSCGRRSTAARSCPSSPRRSCRSWRRSSTASSTSCSTRARGSSRRCPTAARRCRACATSSRRRARCCARPRVRLGRDFYARSVHDVARDLVGCVVRHGETAGRIVETESYHMEEPACHAYAGVTERTQHAVRRAGPRVRVLLVRHPLAAERGGRGGRASAPPC